jgi:D-beta-D-heptose 7-phosphate kinase/D-beta-D-heptose 1-phosphate adenosyltransferase
VPIVQLDRTRTHNTAGGAGSVARDLAALGAKVIAAGVVGDDAEGRVIRETLAQDGVDISLVTVDKERPTTQKTRILSKSHHLLRIDSEERKPLPADRSNQLIAGSTAMVRHVDAVILSDYDKGVLSWEVIQRLTCAARDANKPVWADPARGRDFTVFSGVTAVTPNRKETEEATGLKVPYGEVPQAAARKLIVDLSVRVAVITLDSEGMYYCTESGEEEFISAIPRATHDVTGAGDMVIAAAVFGVSCGMSLHGALHLANFAAGMEVERIGVAPIPREQMLRRLASEAGISSEKATSIPELARILEQRRRRGERVVFTNGCFDILHAGHVKFLQFARRQGDLLVVGLNSDASVRRIKGAPRPILPLGERAALLSALEAVDYVVIFEEDTPAALINEVKPDILVKGEDWRQKGVAGREAVESQGGEVILAPLVPDLSTTGIIERIVEAYSGGRHSE